MLQRKYSLNQGRGIKGEQPTTPAEIKPTQGETLPSRGIKGEQPTTSKPRYFAHSILPLLLGAGALILLSSCSFGSGNKQTIPLVVQHGHAITEKSVNRYLTGQVISSDQDIKSAEKQYIRIGDFCNAARLYILQYQVRGLDNVSFIDDASRFADLGNCEIEQNIISFVHGEDYSENQLPTFYQLLSKYDRDAYSHSKFVESLATDNNLKAFTKTSGIRLAVSRMLRDPDVETSLIEEYITQMLIPTDEAYSYTTNLEKDYTLLEQVYRQQGRNTAKIAETIRLLDSELNYIR